MAGLTEQAGQGGSGGDDSFWTWRQVMYGFVGRLMPEQVQAIAAQLYVEMLKAGYTAVGEFHYLHHDPEGRPYADLAEMSERIVAAAQATGIGLTHLPVLYGYGGFGGQPAGSGQRRFLNDVDGLPAPDQSPAAAPSQQSAGPHRHRAAFAAGGHGGDAEGGGGRPRRVRRQGADPHPHRRAGEGSAGLPRLVATSGRSSGCCTISRSARAGASSTPPT